MKMLINQDIVFQQAKSLIYFCIDEISNYGNKRCPSEAFMLNYFYNNDCPKELLLKHSH